MRIQLVSVLVDDQAKALDFYTQKLGFVVCQDLALGAYRWLTVTSPDGIAGVELVLEPLGFPPAREYQRALYAAGIPATAFLTDDIASEYARLLLRGVEFRGEPQAMGSITAVLFEDGCGNLLHLVQPAV